MKKQVIALALASVLIVVGCTPAQLAVVGEIDNIVATVLPWAETAANIIIGIEAPGVGALATAIENRINAGFQLLETYVATLTATNGQTVAKQVAAEATAMNADIAQLNTLANVSPAEQATVKALAAGVTAAINEIVALLPSSTASAKEVATSKVKIGAVLVNYRHNYNQIVRTKTGDPRVDAVLAKQHLFRHKVLGVPTVAY